VLGHARTFSCCRLGHETEVPDDKVRGIRGAQVSVFDAEVVFSVAEFIRRIQLVSRGVVQEPLLGGLQIALRRLLGKSELRLVATETFLQRCLQFDEENPSPRLMKMSANSFIVAASDGSSKAQT
jgi:hypothetical protein